MKIKAMIGQQVFAGLEFAGRKTYSGIDKPLKNIVFDYIESNIIENL